MFFNFSKKAIAHINGSKEFPKINGVVTFKEVSNGVIMTAQIHGLPQSKDKCKR